MYYRFGKCEPYKGDLGICDNIFTVEVDYVFVSRLYDTQEYIYEFLKENIERVLKLQSSYCRDKLYQIICNYYLSPCGTESSPYSICHEDCSAVEMECPEAWEIAKLGLKEYQFINCNDTSALLFPLPSCCMRGHIYTTAPGERK